jgi:hypothetical protein
MIKFFKVLFGIGIAITLFYSSFSCADNLNHRSKLFDSCTKIKGNRYHCTINKTTDFAKIKGYACQGDTCIIYSSSMSKLVPKTGNTTSKDAVYGHSNMPYALCSMSKCKIDKNNPNTAICNCPIINTKNNVSSISISPYTREKSLPVYDANGNMVKLTSTFSMINVFGFKHKKAYQNVTLCEYTQDHVYTDCFGVICDVDKHNALNAICRCPLQKAKAFISVAGKCDTSPDEVYCARNPEQFQHAGIYLLYKHFNYIKGIEN